MATLYLRKLYDSFVPVDQAGADAMEKMKPGQEYKAEITLPRNLGYHKRFFALLDVAYEAWEAPTLEYRGIQVTKNRERFRKDITILCGYYAASVNYKGDVRCDALSISFANMDQLGFEELYSKAIDVILGTVLMHYTKNDLDAVVNKVLGFA